MNVIGLLKNIRKEIDMKIQLIISSSDLKEKGFNINDIYDVQEVNIIGDSSGYDIYYKVQNKMNRTEYLHDILVEQLEENEKINKFIEKFNKFDQSINMLYRYKFDIKL